MYNKEISVVSEPDQCDSVICNIFNQTSIVKVMITVYNTFAL